MEVNTLKEDTFVGIIAVILHDNSAILLPVEGAQVQLPHLFYSNDNECLYDC